MTDEPAGGGLHIDDDWKSEAAREKERLAKQERRERPSGGGEGQTGPTGSATFMELINLLAFQAVIGLGGMQGPGGERIPPNHAAAQHHIDLLDLLRTKTEGNLTEEEKRTLEAVLYELRMQYVQTVSPPPPPGPKKKTV